MVRDSSGRGGRTYRYAEHGGGDTGQQYGNYLLAQGAGARIYKPSWDANPTTVRMFSALSPDDPTRLDPFRWSADARNFGDWIRRYPAVSNFGSPGVTMFIHDQAALENSGDLQMSPCWVLYNAIKQSVAQRTDHGGWAGLLTGGPGRGAVLSKPGDIALVQCGLVDFRGRQYMPPKGLAQNDDTTIFSMTGKLADTLTTMLGEARSDWAGPPEDYANSFLHGDPISLEHGKYLTVYKLGEDPRQRGMAQQQPGHGQMRSMADAFATGGNRGGQNFGQQGSDERGYGCFFQDAFAGYSANWSEPTMASAVMAKAKLWDQILWFPTHEQQAAIIADKFPADMICYAFRSRPEWIPDHVQRAALGSVSVAMDGHQAPGLAAPGGPMPSMSPGLSQPSFGQGNSLYGAPAQSVQAQPQPGYAPAAQAAPAMGYPQSGIAAQPQQPVGQPPQGYYGGAPTAVGSTPTYAMPSATTALPPQAGYQQPAQPGQQFGQPQPMDQQPAPVAQPTYQPQLMQQGYQPAMQQPMHQQPVQQAYQQPYPQQPQQQQPVPQTWAGGGGLVNTAVGHGSATNYLPVQDSALPQGGIPNDVPFDPSRVQGPMPQVTAPQPFQPPVGFAPTGGQPGYMPQQQQPAPQMQPPVQQGPLVGTPVQQPPQMSAVERARLAAGRR